MTCILNHPTIITGTAMVPYMAKDKIDWLKDKALSFFLFIFSMFCSQTICYYYYDEFIKYFTSSIYTFIIPRVIFTFLIYIFITLLIKRTQLTKNKKIFILLLYISLIMVLTFRPITFRGFNIIPFQFLKGLHINIYLSFLLMGNIIIYIPVGFALCNLTKASAVRTLLLQVLVFIVIVEIVQYSLMLGVFDIDDIMLNYIGFLLGYFSLYYINKHKKIL